MKQYEMFELIFPGEALTDRWAQIDLTAEFICGDAREEAQKLVARGIQPDVVIVDPPRKGCSEEAVELLNNIAPKRIVYISCDPATLARDVARLRQYGWQVERFTAVDMFPRTANVETVALLHHKKAANYL